MSRDGVREVGEHGGDVDSDSLYLPVLEEMG